MDRKGLYELLMGKEEYSKYKEVFDRFIEVGIFYPSWNWGAFFFGSLWLLYRKLGGMVFVFWFLCSGMVYITGTISSAIYTFVIYIIIFKVLFACYANQILYLRVDRVATRILSDRRQESRAQDSRNKFATIRDPAPDNPRLW